MPVDFDIDPTNCLVTLRFYGLVTEGDVRGARRALDHALSDSPSYSELIDARQVDRVQLSLGVLWDLRRADRGYREGTRRAVVVQQRGLLHLFQAYTALPHSVPTELRAFDDFAAACEWLGIEATAPAPTPLRRLTPAPAL